MVLGIAYYYSRHYEDALDTFASVLLLDRTTFEPMHGRGGAMLIRGRSSWVCSFFWMPWAGWADLLMLLEQLGRFLG